jgi:hypothetical protein
VPKTVIKVRCSNVLANGRTCRVVLDEADMAILDDGRLSIILRKPSDELSAKDATMAARVDRKRLLNSRPSIRKAPDGGGGVRWGCKCGANPTYTRRELSRLLLAAARAGKANVEV